MGCNIHNTSKSVKRNLIQLLKRWLRKKYIILYHCAFSSYLNVFGDIYEKRGALYILLYIPVTMYKNV